jgi:hypothetical protein
MTGFWPVLHQYAADEWEWPRMLHMLMHPPLNKLIITSKPSWVYLHQAIRTVTPTQFMAQAKDPGTLQPFGALFAPHCLTHYNLKLMEQHLQITTTTLNLNFVSLALSMIAHNEQICSQLPNSQQEHS